MLHFSAQDCPPIYLLGGTTAFGIAAGCSLALSPFICAEQRICLVPHLARPGVSLTLRDQASGAASVTGGSPTEATVASGETSATELDRLLPGYGPGRSPRPSSASPLAGEASPQCVLDEYCALLKQAWSGAPELATVYPGSGFYGNLQPSAAELPARLGRLELAPEPEAFTSSLAKLLAASQGGQAPILVLPLCVDEMQTAVERCDPEALKSAGGDVGVVASHMAADQLATLLEQVGHYHRSLPASSAAAAARTTVLVIADDLCRAGLMRYSADLEARAARVGVDVLYTWVHELAPPALDSGLTTASVRGAETGLDTGLASVCASVTLGVQRCMDLPRTEAVPFVPVDVALNVALMEVLLGRRVSSGGGQEGASRLREARVLGQASVASISIGDTGANGTLVWGMLAEYLLDYVGRYAERIQAVFPSGSALTTTTATSAAAPATKDHVGATSSLIDPSPTLQFTGSVANYFRGHYGVGQTTPVPCLLRRQEKKREEELASTTSPLPLAQRRAVKRVLARAAQLHTRTVTALAAVAHSADGARPTRGLSTPALIATAALVPGGTVLAAAQLARNRSGSAKRGSKRRSDAPAEVPSLYAFRVQRYATLLARLSQQCTLAPYLQFVCLGDVDWGMYVRLIARASLFHLARFVVKAPQSDALPFPAPTRLFVNDIVFHGPDRAPPSPVVHRRWFIEADWLARGGMGPGGELCPMSPGMSSRRLATILEQPGIRAVLSTVAANDGTTVAEVEKRAKKILLRLGDTQGQVASRAAGLLVRQLFFKVYDRVNVTRNGFAYLRRLYRRPRTQIVLVPHHRSYSDFLVMTYLLACMSIATPHIVAGEDFLGMGKFADVLRGSGAFFMRRSFRGDPLYGRLFREYVRQLVYHGQSIEFFIEGTRSRTNKTMVPKLGILKFIADALYEGSAADIDDVLIVPVSLSYDELLEAGVYAKELLGIPKPRESVANMLKAGVSLDRLHGSINVAFGDPISLTEYRQNPAQCPPGFMPKAQTSQMANVRASTAAPRGALTPQGAVAALTAAQPLPKLPFSTPAPLLTALGWRIVFELQKNIVVTPSALVAAVLECFSTHSAGAAAGAVPSVSMAKMVALVTWLREHLRVREAHLSRELGMWSPEKVTQGGLDRLVRFVRTRTVSTPAAVSDTTAQTSSSSQQKQQQQTETVVFDPPTVMSRLGVNMSANQLIHLFIDESVISLIAAIDGTAIPGRSDRVVERSTLVTQARFLTSVLAREFPNFSSASPCSFTSWLSFAVGRVQRFGHLEVGVTAQATPSPSTLESSIPPTVPVPASRLFDFHLRLVLPHIEAAYFVACVLSVLLIPEGSSGASGTASSESAAHKGLPSRVLIKAAHLAALELSGEALPKKSVTATAGSGNNGKANQSGGANVKTVEAMAAAEAAAASAAQAAVRRRVLYCTSTTCNKEVLLHYLEAMVDAGAVTLESAPAGVSGHVYRLKDAGALRSMVEGLSRYVQHCASVWEEMNVSTTSHSEPMMNVMKPIIWKHFNDATTSPKL